MELLGALEVFARVSERRNFAAAARDLGVSQATVTRTIQALERHYGVELVRRSTREMVLTEARSRLYQGGSALLAARASLSGQVSDVGSVAPSGLLRITAPSAFGVTFLARMSASFSKRYPAVTLDLLLTDRYLDLVAENIDLAIRIGTPTDSTLIQRKVAELGETLIATPGYLATAGVPQRPSDLTQHSFVALSILRNRPHELRLSNDSGQVITIQPSGSLSFDTPLGVRQAVLAGAGIGRIHRYLVADDIAAGSLVEVLPGWRCPIWAMTLVATARARSSATQAFCEDFVRDLADVEGIKTVVK